MRRILLLLLAIATPAQAAKPPPLGDDPAPPAPRNAARPSASGTGFMVADGRILTAAHVVQGCNRMTARNARNQTVTARIDAVDARRDLAVLSVQSGFGTPLAFRDTPPVRRGDPVVSYGFPLSGLLSSGPSLTTGDISAMAGLRDNPLHFQISTPVQPGNSGGPLLDGQGNIVGVVTSKLNAARVAQMTGGDIPQNVNFAVKGTEAVAFLGEHGVRPKLASSAGVDRRPAEIGQLADPATVFLQCFR